MLFHSFAFRFAKLGSIVWHSLKRNENVSLCLTFHGRRRFFFVWKHLFRQTKSSTLKMCLWAVSLTDIKQTTLLLRLIINNLKIFLVDKIFDGNNSPSRRGTPKLHVGTPEVEGGLPSGRSVCAGSWTLNSHLAFQAPYATAVWRGRKGPEHTFTTWRGLGQVIWDSDILIVGRANLIIPF